MRWTSPWQLANMRTCESASTECKQIFAPIYISSQYRSGVPRSLKAEKMCSQTTRPHRISIPTLCAKSSVVGVKLWRSMLPRLHGCSCCCCEDVAPNVYIVHGVLLMPARTHQSSPGAQWWRILPGRRSARCRLLFCSSVSSSYITSY